MANRIPGKFWHFDSVRSLRGRLRQSAVFSICCAALMPVAAFADTDISSGQTVLGSTLSGTGNFKGGTLQLDNSNTLTNAFNVTAVSGNTIDIHGSSATLSGAFSGSGGLTFLDSVGGGAVTLTGTSYTTGGTTNYTGAFTINSGATVKMADTKDSSGTVTKSPNISGASVVDNGTFDISGASNGTTVAAFSGSGSLVLGSQYLAISTGSGTFSGVASGTGGLNLTSGTETLTGVNTYTGTTIISGGTLALSGNGSIASSGLVSVLGTLDISATTSGATINSLNGSGVVQLGAQNLTFANATGVFSGTISGTGGLIVSGGTQYLTGAISYTGNTLVNSGAALYLGAATIANNVTDNGTLGFYTTGTITMNGTISGTGAVTQSGGGATTITAAQTYTGATTISFGRISLTGSGSIASSSSLTDNGTFDITGTTGSSIQSLAGKGYIYLGSQTLTITHGTDGVNTWSGSISGTGGVTLTGGTEVFSGSNSYTGLTTISGGTLVLQPGASLGYGTVVDNATLDLSQNSTSVVATTASIGSLQGTGNVVLGDHTLIITNAGTTFNGVISGNGGLTLSSGTQTLAGNNTYVGATTVNGGTLVLSNTGSIASASKLAINGVFDMSAAAGPTLTFASLGGSGQVTLGSNNLQIASGADIFSGVITGNGGLIVSGGKEVLSGANTYLGGTTVATGATLQIGSNAYSGSIQGDVVDQGTLAFARADKFVYGGNITGAGAVTQVSVGTTVLTGTNTYSGGTTINTGTIQIGNGGTSGSITGNVADNGTLAFGRTDVTTFGGTISDATPTGHGAVSVLSGDTTLTATNTYTGGTTVANGATLRLGGTGSISSSSLVTVNGTLDMTGTTVSTVKAIAGSGTILSGASGLEITAGQGNFGGSINGAGGLILDSGTQSLSGTNAYTGATDIKGGVLVVTGSIANSSGITVESGATLSGSGTAATANSGTVSAVTVMSGGKLAPSATGTGVLNVNGNVSLASGSTLAISTSSAATTKVSASGTATVANGAILTVTSSDGTYKLGQKLAVLTAAGGVNSNAFTLTPITSSGAQFSSALSYDANNVWLQIDLAKLSPLLPTGATRNETNLVGAIDAAIAHGTALPLPIENLGNDSSAQLASDADQLVGELGGTVPLAGNRLMSSFMDSMFDHLHGSGNPLRAGSRAWLTGFGGTEIVDGNPTDGSHDYRSTAVGVAGGQDWLISNNMMVGAALSVAVDNFKAAGLAGKGNAKAAQLGIYGYIQYSRHFYGSFAAALQYDQITTSRTVTVSGTDVLTGKANSLGFGGRYETGIQLAYFTPYVAVQDKLVKIPSFSEKAASGSAQFALRYSDNTVNTADAEVGIRQNVDIEFTPRWIATPDGTLHLFDKLAWSHQLLGDSTMHAAFDSLPGSQFDILSARPKKDAALMTLGADLEFDGGLHVSANLDGAVTQKSQSYMGMGGVAYRW